MFVPETSDELEEILRAVTPAYEEGLKRAFQNEGIRQQIFKGSNNIIKSHRKTLGDVLFTVGGNTIELKRLELVRPPDFMLNRLSLDLLSMVLQVALSLGDVQVDGNFVVHDQLLQSILPVSKGGRFSVTLRNVMATGKIGAFLRDDSLVAENYDIAYEPEEVSVMVVSYGEDDQKEVLTRRTIDETVASKFWPQLRDLLTELLHLQLISVIAQDSIAELLADKEEELRQISYERTVLANRILDHLLCSAKDDVASADRRTLKIPSFGVAFPGRRTGIDGRKQRGILAAEAGYVRDLSTLTRTRDMSMYEDQSGALVVFGYLGLGEFRCGHAKYCCEHSKTTSSGSILATIHRNKVFLRLSVFLRPSYGSSACLENVQVCGLNDVDLVVTGLGPLSWLTGDIESWTVGSLRSEGLPALEKEFSAAFERACKRGFDLSQIYNK